MIHESTNLTVSTGLTYFARLSIVTSLSYGSFNTLRCVSCSLRVRPPLPVERPFPFLELEIVVVGGTSPLLSFWSVVFLVVRSGDDAFVSRAVFPADVEALGFDGFFTGCSSISN